MPNPQRRHPHGWQGYTVTINLDDLRRPGTLGVPKLEIDIAAPETLRSGAVTELHVRNGSVLAYSPARQTAEKLRAFLQSSPAWRAKMHSTDRAIRVKDLVDLVAVVRQYPLDDSVFWDNVAEEFVLACKERLVDCEGWSTFEAMERDTRSTFAGDVGLQRLATMDTCWGVLRSVVDGLSRLSECETLAPWYGHPWRSLAALRMTGVVVALSRSLAALGMTGPWARRCAWNDIR